MSSKAGSKAVYNDVRWLRARKAAIIRAAGRCQIQLPGCTIVATQGDHIVSLEDGGLPFALSNVQAACRHCNVAKENNRRLGLADQFVTSRQW